MEDIAQKIQEKETEIRVRLDELTMDKDLGPLLLEKSCRSKENSELCKLSFPEAVSYFSRMSDLPLEKIEQGVTSELTKLLGLYLDKQELQQQAAMI